MGEEYTKEQIKLWEAVYTKSLTDSDYEEIAANLNCFFSILNKWREEDKIGLTNKKEGTN